MLDCARLSVRLKLAINQIAYQRPEERRQSARVTLFVPSVSSHRRAPYRFSYKQPLLPPCMHHLP